MSTYFAQSNVFGNYWPQIEQALQVGHISYGASLDILNSTSVRAILDIRFLLFNTSCGIHPNIINNVNILLDSILPYMSQGKIAAFYIMDEPFVNGCVLDVVEEAIGIVKKYIPSIPAYITFARHCFDPTFVNPACPNSGRGIPTNLDWIGFDWYMDNSNDCGQGIWEQFQCRITGGINKLQTLLKPTQRAILVPDALTLFYQEKTLIELLHCYYHAAATSSIVLGMDLFLWPNNPPQFNGIVSMPTYRATARSFARLVSYQCGKPYTMIPILQFSLINTSGNIQDIIYVPWFWDGYFGSGYLAQGAMFALAPPNTDGTVSFFDCHIESTTGRYTHYLTVSPTCNGIPHVGEPIIIGNIFTGAAVGTTGLWRYCTLGAPFAHLYTTYSGTISGLVKEFIVGYVYDSTLI